jgi:hypothetical protein
MTDQSPNRRLKLFRQWHMWGGLAAGACILLAGVSGVVLNYKQPVFRALGLERKAMPDEPAREKSSPPAVKITTATALHTLPVTWERALELARAEWGDTPLERLELKAEAGEITYKLKRKGGGELWVNAVTGDHFFKGEYEKRLSKAGPVQTDWGKILIDLHTGKIAGATGKAVMSVAAVMLVFLTLSGVYLWVKPVLIRRRNKAWAKAV